MQTLLALGLSILLPGILKAQQTVGLLSLDSSSFHGYTLFAPLSSDTTYLIDPCGRKINTWVSEYNPGMSVYLLEDGNLLHTAKRGGFPFSSGGASGRVEIL